MSGDEYFIKQICSNTYSLTILTIFKPNNHNFKSCVYRRTNEFDIARSKYCFEFRIGK